MFFLAKKGKKVITVYVNWNLYSTYKKNHLFDIALIKILFNVRCIRLSVEHIVLATNWIVNVLTIVKNLDFDLKILVIFYYLTYPDNLILSRIVCCS